VYRYSLSPTIQLKGIKIDRLSASKALSTQHFEFLAYFFQHIRRNVNSF
jgi:hypothetical protein